MEPPSKWPPAGSDVGPFHCHQHPKHRDSESKKPALPFLPEGHTLCDLQEGLYLTRDVKFITGSYEGESPPLNLEEYKTSSLSPKEKEFTFEG